MRLEDRIALATPVFVAILVWAASPAILTAFWGKWDVRAQVGDSFGAVNAIFSALALGYAIYAVLMQREELVIQRQEHKIANDERKAHREASERQEEALKKQEAALTLQARVQALQGQIAALELRIKATSDAMETAESIRRTLAQYTLEKCNVKSQPAANDLLSQVYSLPSWLLKDVPQTDTFLSNLNKLASNERRGLVRDAEKFLENGMIAISLKLSIRQDELFKELSALSEQIRALGSH